MRTVGTIGIPARHPPARAGTMDWSPSSPSRPVGLGRDMTARRQWSGARLLSVWLLLLAGSWAVMAGLVWLLLYAFGTT